MREHPFDRFQAARSEQRHDEAVYQWEAQIVDLLLKTHGLSKWRRRLFENEERNRSVARLTLQSFRELVPEYPVFLGASLLDGKTLHDDPDAFIPTMFKRFDKTPWMPHYERFYEENVRQADERGQGVGLVFRRHGINNGVILHSSSFQYTFHPGACVAVYCVPEDYPLEGMGGQRLYWQPFQKLIEAIRERGWRP